MQKTNQTTMQTVAGIQSMSEKVSLQKLESTSIGLNQMEAAKGTDGTVGIHDKGTRLERRTLMEAVEQDTDRKLYQL